MSLIHQNQRKHLINKKGDINQMFKKTHLVLALVSITLAGCFDTGSISNSSNQSNNLTSSTSQTQSLIEFNFSDEILDENNQPLPPLNNSIEVTKKYKLTFTMQVIQAHISRIPELGIDSTLKITFSSPELFELNKNRLTGQIGGSTSMVCESVSGSNQIQCNFTLTRERLDTSRLFFEITAASRKNTSTTQPVTLDITTLSNAYIYRINNNQGTTIRVTWYINLIPTTYNIEDPELQFSQQFGQVKIFLPIGIGEVNLYGYKPNANPPQLLIDKTNLPFAGSDEAITVNLFQIYVDSLNGNVVFARNNPIDFVIVFEANDDYNRSEITISIDYNSFFNN